MTSKSSGTQEYEERITKAKHDRNEEYESMLKSRDDIIEDNKAKLDEAWKELDDERNKIGRLDIEVANLKDLNAKLEQSNKELLQTVNTLYNLHRDLMEQSLKTSSALSITNGKLNEAIVRTQFIIPETTDK